MVKPAGDGVALFYSSILLLALSWITFLTRISVRVWRKAFGLDDWLMLAGLVCELLNPTLLKEMHRIWN